MSELIEKAKAAKTPEELLTILKEAGQDVTLEEAKEAFEHLPEASDEDLENVAGGFSKGRTRAH